MKIAVVAHSAVFHALPVLEEGAAWICFETLPGPETLTQLDGLIHVGMDAANHDYTSYAMPVFINSVSHTLAQQSHPDHVVRFNGWPGFFEKAIWEISGQVSAAHAKILHKLGKEWIELPDVAGFVSCRMIAMIINEAFFALASGVSTKEDMDTAMKLGTNYPFGPFEWAEKIGYSAIYDLLIALAKTDERYKPCTRLTNTN